MKTDVFTKVVIPVFTQKEEILSLVQIIETKKIISVTITYLSSKKEIKVKGWKGFFGSKEISQEEKVVTINDLKGITFYFTEKTDLGTIRFWDKKEFQKFDNKDYDENTLWTRYVMSMVSPYQVNFHIGNLKEIKWIKKDN